MTLVATHAGLRGQPGSELSPALVGRTVAALVELLRDRKLPPALAVARDERPEGKALAVNVIRAALHHGADVVDLGVVTTPAAKLFARSHGLGGAVVVTGSHLAPHLNGLKLVAGPHYAPVDIGKLPQPPTAASGHQDGHLRSDHLAASEHVEAVCAVVDVELIRSAGLAVVPQGGAGPGAGLLLERLGCARPGPPDAGVLLDADGDRLALLDAQGNLLDSELTLPLAVCAREALRVVKGEDTSSTTDALVEARGGRVHLVPPGEIHLVEALLGAGGDLAGEGNGGVVVPAVGLARDGIATAAAIFELLARSGKRLSALCAELPSFARRRSTLPCDDADRARAALETLAARLGSEPRVATVGVRVEVGPQIWGLVRLSATEPVLRIAAEAPTQREADDLHAELRGAMADGAASS